MKSNMADQKFIECEDFDKKKFDIMKGFKCQNDESPGYNSWPKYKYDDGEDNLSIVTGEIEMCYGGIPNVKEPHRKTDDDCLYVWIPLSERNGVKNKGGKQLLKVLSDIDKLTQNKLDNDKEYLTVSDSKGKKELKSNKNIVISKCARDYKPGNNNDDEDENSEEEDEDEVKEKFYRLKAKIDIESKWDNVKKMYDAKQKTIVKTKVTVTDKNGNGKEEKIKSLDDLRRYVAYGSTLVFQIELVKTYWSKNKVNGSKLLTHTFVVKQVLVMKQGTGGTNKIVSNSVFAGRITGKINNNDSDDEKKDKKKSNKDSDDESDSDNDNKKKKDKKKSKKDSDDDSDSDNDNKKKKDKKKSTKDSDDDSDSDNDNKKKKDKKKSTKDSDDDSDNDKKKKLVKKNKNDSDSDSDSDNSNDSD